MRRLVLVAATLGLTGGLLAGSAQAALWLLFSKTVAHPGESVVVRTAGNGAFRKALETGELRSGPPLRLFLVREAVADRVRSPADGRLVVVGRLAIDRRGNGRLRFSVPNLVAGSYTARLHCVPCASYSAGRTLLPVGPLPGPFRIAEPVPVVKTCETAQHGEIPPGWERTNAVRAGPLTLFFFQPVASLRSAQFAAVRGRRGHFRPTKVLALVAGRSPVTLRVPRAERRSVGLLYRLPRLPRAARIVDALPLVRFQPCLSAETQFGGGFVVAGARCAHLEVLLEKRSEPMSLDVPFGARC